MRVPRAVLPSPGRDRCRPKSAVRPGLSPRLGASSGRRFHSALDPNSVNARRYSAVRFSSPDACVLIASVFTMRLRARPSVDPKRSQFRRGLKRPYIPGVLFLSSTCSSEARVCGLASSVIFAYRFFARLAAETTVKPGPLPTTVARGRAAGGTAWRYRVDSVGKIPRPAL